MKQIIVKSCEECPLAVHFLDGRFCQHPDGDVNWFLHDGMPVKCPLRYDTLIVMVTEKERRRS